MKTLLFENLNLKKKTGTTGTGTRVYGCGHEYGYTGAGTGTTSGGYNGRARVRVGRVFSKNIVPYQFHTRTRVPVYPPIPGHGHGYPG